MFPKTHREKEREIFAHYLILSKLIYEKNLVLQNELDPNPQRLHIQKYNFLDFAQCYKKTITRITGA